MTSFLIQRRSYGEHSWWLTVSGYLKIRKTWWVFEITERRQALKESLSNRFKPVKLFAVTGDYWKNKFTSESYFTITLHFGFDNKIEVIVLKTALFQASKTGGENERKGDTILLIDLSLENTLKLIHDTLESYGINTALCHIVYVADNGSNLVSALKDEAHMRCVCHCINLAVT